LNSNNIEKKWIWEFNKQEKQYFFDYENDKSIKFRVKKISFSKINQAEFIKNPIEN
jgi:hypothetical protein